MEAEIVDRSAAWILGVPARINPAETNYKEIWENRFMPRHEEIRALAEAGGYCAAYFPCEQPGKADFVAGMLAPAGIQVPAGLVLRPLPAGAYARVRCRLAEIGATWGAIYREWLPGSPYDEDETRPAIELHPPETSGADAPVAIFVAVRPKEAYP